jgi:hypothetical protein
MPQARQEGRGQSFFARRAGRRLAVKWLIKPVMLLLSLGAGVPMMLGRIVSLGLSPSLLAYFGLWGILAACLGCAAYVRPASLRWGYALVLSGSAFYLDAYAGITGEAMSYDAFINMLNSAAFADEALSQHAAIILRAFAFAALMFVAIALPPRAKFPAAHLAAIAPVLGVVLLTGITFTRGGEGANGLPGPFVPLAYSGLHLYELASSPSVVRQPVKLTRGAGPVRRDIVLIIDESIAARYLDINDAGGVHSGLMAPRPGVDVYNYGLAASINNCSVGSNVTLRYGGTRADYRRINAAMPSIWDYAKSAGMRTVYIDAQRTGGRLQNLMDAAELGKIDDFIQFDGVPVRDRDMAAADRLVALLGDTTAQFIIVNKVGAHFPVQDKYPDAFTLYRPALPRGSFADVGDTGSRAGFGGSPHEWSLYRNSYRNTVGWNVGAFFDKILARGALANATVIYTSDHGQDLHEAGKVGVDTHCSIKPQPQEGLVPLVVLEGGRSGTLPWRQSVAGNANRMSHYRIFPTLLALMGYDPNATRRTYGASLVAADPDPFTFNSRFNARLGRGPAWVHIDLAKVPRPADNLAIK